MGDDVRRFVACSMQKDNTYLNETHGPLKSTYYIHFEKNHFYIIHSTLDKINYLITSMDDTLTIKFIKCDASY